MIAAAMELRELADLLNKFPGIKATEWTPGEFWTLYFVASRRTTQHLNSLVEVLNSLNLARVPFNAWAEDVRDTVSYRIGEGGDHLRLTERLRAVEKKLWRFS